MCSICIWYGYSSVGYLLVYLNKCAFDYSYERVCMFSIHMVSVGAVARQKLRVVRSFCIMHESNDLITDNS